MQSCSKQFTCIPEVENFPESYIFLRSGAMNTSWSNLETCGDILSSKRIIFYILIYSIIRICWGLSEGGIRYLYLTCLRKLSFTLAWTLKCVVCTVVSLLTGYFIFEKDITENLSEPRVLTSQDVFVIKQMYISEVQKRLSNCFTTQLTRVILTCMLMLLRYYSWTQL